MGQHFYKLIFQLPNRSGCLTQADWIEDIFLLTQALPKQGGGGGAQWAKLEGQAVKLDVTLHCEDFG